MTPADLLAAHNLDQDQSAARDWFAETIEGGAAAQRAIATLVFALSSEDSGAVRRLDNVLLDVTQRLALLKLHELCADYSRERIA